MSLATSPANPRGVLRPHLSQGQFEHHRQLPSQAPAAWVEHYWYVRWDLRGMPDQEQAILPHPHVHVVAEQGQTRVFGVHQGRFVRQLQGQGQVFGIKFKPGGFYPLYGKPVAELLNQSIEATTCWGGMGADFACQVLAATRLEDKCALAERLLLPCLPAPDPQVASISALLERVARDSAITSVEHLCVISGLNKRALQRLFQKYVGVGPKWVIQRYRLHEAIAQVQTGKPLNWATLALELGYFDQAHFVRDFRQLVGMAPSEYQHSLAEAIRR
jgi:AraC-like DNA-binding protein